MAVDATHAVHRMDGIDRVHVIGAAGMACQTAITDRLSRDILKCENLGDVASAIHVRLAGSVAGLATLLGRSTLRVQRRFPVRRFGPVVVDVFMAGFAGL